MHAEVSEDVNLLGLLQLQQDCKMYGYVSQTDCMDLVATHNEEHLKLLNMGSLELRIGFSLFCCGAAN